MPFDASQFDQVKIKFEKLLPDVVDVTMAEMIQAGDEILALAKLQAPVDEGNLENAIKIRYTGGGLRNAKGQFVKGGGIVVYVDNEMPAVKDDGQPITRHGEQVKVGDYAWFVHENVTPAGPLNLGEKSQIKQQAVAGFGVEVGGWYMTRAAEKIRFKVEDKIGRAVAQVIEALDF